MPSSSSKMQEAEHLKAKGNQCFKQKLYNKAVYFYTQALDLDPDNAVILANRAQVYLNLHKFVGWKGRKCKSMFKLLDTKRPIWTRVALCIVIPETKRRCSGLLSC